MPVFIHAEIASLFMIFLSSTTIPEFPCAVLTTVLLGVPYDFQVVLRIKLLEYSLVCSNEG